MNEPDQARTLRPVPLIFGTAFVTIGALGLWPDQSLDGSVIWIIILGAVGLAGLLATVVGLRSSH